jgi:transposase
LTTQCTLHAQELAGPPPVHEQEYLEPDNNYAERGLRPVVLGRKNFLFVGCEPAGRAAAIYYSLVESCKVNSSIR